MKKLALIMVFVLMLLLGSALADADYAILVSGSAPQGQVTLDMSRETSVTLSGTLPTTWSSSDRSRAQVDASGKLTLLKPGTVTINAQASDGTRRALKIKIVRGVLSIDVTGPDQLMAGRSATLKAQVAPSNATSRAVTWTSSDPTVLSVGKYGRISAAKGLTEKKTVTITATASDGSGVVGTKTVTVYPAVTAITLYVNGEKVNGKTLPVDIAANPRVTVSAVVEPADAAQGLTWGSSSRAAATVEGGVVTGHRKGTVTITATAADGSRVKATVRLSLAVLAKGVTVTGADRISAGQSLSLKAAVTPADATSKQVTWTSSDPAVVSVNRNGRITAKKGLTEIKTVTITATAADGSGVMGKKEITVYPVATSITIYMDGKKVNGQTIPLDIAANPNVKLTAVVEPAAASQEVTWGSSSRAVATVEGGSVTGRRKGTAAITVTAADGSRVKASVRLSLTVLAKGASISGPEHLSAGQSGTLRAVITPADTVNKRVTWTSSDPAVVSVNSYGRVTAAKGLSEVKTVTITATAADGSGVKATHQITVHPVAASITILQGGQSVNGKTLGIDISSNPTLQLSAQVQPAAASQEVRWVSSARLVASVGEDGLVRGGRKGTATLTAISADGKVRASVKVEVTVRSTSVTVSGPKQVSAGKSIQLKATVGPSDAGNKKVTWTSSDPSVATVNLYGVVTGQTVTTSRTVTITAAAQDGGSKGTYKVIVVPRAISVNVTRDGAEIPSVIFVSPTQKGTKIKLKGSVYPAEASQALSWSTNRRAVAYADDDGTIHIANTGEAVITVRAKDGSSAARQFYVVVADTSALPYYIEVDKANQVVRVYERGDGSYTKLIRRFICSTGVSDYILKSRLYTMHGGRNPIMPAADRYHYMPYATRIDGQYLFHGVPTIGPYYDKVVKEYYAKLGTRASGGCVRILSADARWIYENVPRGTYCFVMDGVRRASEYGAVYAPPMTGDYDPTDNNPNNPTYDPTYTSLIGG